MSKKTYRKYAVTTLAAAAAVASVAPVVTAAETTFPDLSTNNTHYDNIQKLVGLGAISGDENGNFNPSDDLRRGQAAKIIVASAGLDLVSKSEAAEILKDVADVDENHILGLEIATAYKAGIISGYSNGSFGPDDSINRQQLAKVLVEGLNLDEIDVDKQVDIEMVGVDSGAAQGYVQTLANLGITKGNKDGKYIGTETVLRDAFASFAIRTLDVVNEQENKAPEVKSVSAINATQVEVEFTQAVDKDEVETDYATIFFVGSTASAESAELSKDGKTATVTFDGSIEGENQAVVVEPVTTVADDNVQTKRYAKIMTYKDTVKPEVEKIESKTGGDSASSATVYFTEPIASHGAVKLNGTSLSQSSTDGYELAADGLSMKITGQNMDATKDQVLEIVNLTDKANDANVTAYTKETFKTVVDKEAPVVNSVEAQSDSALVFTFSKPVVLDGETASDSVKLFDEDLSNETSTLLDTKTFSEVPDSNGTKFVVDLNASPFSGNEKTVKLTAQIKDKIIADELGNKVAKDTKTVTINKDEVAPSLVKANYRTDNDGKVKELSFTFDENVTTAATTDLKDLLSDKATNNANGVLINDLDDLFTLDTTDDEVEVDGNVIKFKFDTHKELSGKYTFEVKKDAVSDAAISPNKNKAQSFTLDFGDATSEETFKVDSVDDSTPNTIIVKFKEAVKGGTGANSATSLNAYKLNGNPLPEGTTITLNSDQDKATIIFPDGTIEKSDDKAIFIADSIASKDGKKTLEKYTGTVDTKDNVAPELTGATLTEDNDLLITFSEAVKSEDIDDLEISINGTVVDNDADGSAPMELKKGTGSDSGKYIINLSQLIEFNNGTSGKTEIVLTNGNIEIADSDVTDSFKYSTSSAIDSIKVKVVDNATEDKAGNNLKKGTEIKVK